MNWGVSWARWPADQQVELSFLHLGHGSYENSSHLPRLSLAEYSPLVQILMAWNTIHNFIHSLTSFFLPSFIHFMLWFQVQSLLNTTPPDDTSDHGSSCDSGRGPSEEEPDHSRHSNNLSDPCLYPVMENAINSSLQHVHCSCKPQNSNTINSGASQRPSSAVGYNNPGLQMNSGFQRTPSFQSPHQNEDIWCTTSPTQSTKTSPSKKCACPHDLQKCVKVTPKVAPPPPRRTTTLMTSKPLPELPQLPQKEYGGAHRDHDSADGDSEAESTTTSGSYMVDAMLDLSGEGPQISPCDVYVWKCWLVCVFVCLCVCECVCVWESLIAMCDAPFLLYMDYIWQHLTGISVNIWAWMILSAYDAEMLGVVAMTKWLNVFG